MKVLLFALRTVTLLLVFSWTTSGFPLTKTSLLPTAWAADGDAAARSEGGTCFPKPDIAAPHNRTTASMDTYITSSELPFSGSALTTPAPLPPNRTWQTAIELTPDVPVEGYLPASIQDCVFFPEALWYKITLDRPQKITALLLTPPGLDYNLFLESTASFRHGPYDQVSYVAGPGTYYIHVDEGNTKGSLTQPFNLKVMLNDNFDDYERYSDDSSATDAGYDLRNPIPTVHTIDSIFDEDWMVFVLDYSGKLTVRLDNPSSKGVYRAELIGGSTNLMYTIKQNTPQTIELPQDAYFIRVYAPSTYDPDTPYTLTMNFESDPQPVCDWDEDKPWEWVCTGP